MESQLSQLRLLNIIDLSSIDLWNEPMGKVSFLFHGLVCLFLCQYHSIQIVKNFYCVLISKYQSNNHYIYYCGQESLRRNGVAIIVNKRVWSAVLGCNLKNDSIISVRFQGKPFNITVIQVYALTSNAEEAEVEWFYEDLQDLLVLTPKKDVFFIIGDWNAKVTGKFGLGVQNEARQMLIEFCQENAMVIANTLFQQHKIRLYTWTSSDGQYWNQIDYILWSQRWRSTI